jgi:hypothetical protein
MFNILTLYVIQCGLAPIIDFEDKSSNGNTALNDSYYYAQHVPCKQAHSQKCMKSAQKQGL